jgi:hypothetical protein
MKRKSARQSKALMSGNFMTRLYAKERWDPEAIKINQEHAHPHEVPKILPIGELKGTPSKCLGSVMC